MNRNKAARVIQSAYKRRKTAHLTLYNGSLDFKFEMNIKYFFDKIVEEKPPEVRRVSIINSSFKDVKVWTKTTGVFGTSEPKYHAMRVMLYYKGRNHNFVMFKSGKIQYSGGYPVNAVVNASEVPYTEWFSVPAKVFNIAMSNDMMNKNELMTESKNQNKDAMGLNNVTLQAQPILAVPKFDTFVPELRKQYTNVVQEPELFSFVKFKHLGVSFRIMSRGAVQVSGITSPKLVPKILEFIYGDLKKLMMKHAARKVNAITYTKSRPVNNYRKATTCPKNRCPVPYTFDGVCPDIGVPTFIAPTKSGFPCCYAVPKKKEYRRNALIKRFKELGIAIPKVTKNAFGITNANEAAAKNLPKNASGYRFSNTEKTGNILRNFKIGTRQCGRHTLKELSHIAAVLQLPPSIVALRSKEELCKAIREKSRNIPAPNSPNVVRIGGRRCDTFSKTELKKKAYEKFGIELNSSKSLKEMCAEIQKMHNAFENAFRSSAGSNRSPNR